MIKILVCHNNPEIRYGIYNHLKNDYEVFITKSIKEIYSILNQTNIDILIFNCLVDDVNNLVEKAREIRPKILTMFLSSLRNEKDKKKLLYIDIDDYIDKPFDMIELSFRIEHLLKKQCNEYKKIIETDNCKLNCETYTLTYKSTKYEFFNKEFQILYVLFSYPNKIFSKYELSELLYDGNYFNENTIRTYINTLRKKISEIKELEIITIRGLGYKGIIKSSN